MSFRPVCHPYLIYVRIANPSILEFDKLVRLVQRQVNFTERVPSFFIRSLVELEETISNAITKEKEAKKKLNATHARALNGLKQKIKKLLKEHETDVKHFQEASSSIFFVFGSILMFPSGSRRL